MALPAQNEGHARSGDAFAYMESEINARGGAAQGSATSASVNGAAKGQKASMMQDPWMEAAQGSRQQQAGGKTNSGEPEPRGMAAAFNGTGKGMMYDNSTSFTKGSGKTKSGEQESRGERAHHGFKGKDEVHGKAAGRGATADKANGFMKGSAKTKASEHEFGGNRGRNGFKGQHNSSKGSRMPPEVEAFVHEHRQERIQAGRSVFAQEVTDAIHNKFGLDPRACQSMSEVATLARFEQGLRQFLVSMRAHAVIWSVVDLEVAFLRSNLQKKDSDIKEWCDLRVGPFHQHPVLTEVFPEFQEAQRSWSQASSSPGLLRAIDVMLALLQHRNDVGFKERVLLPDFMKWFEQTKGAPMGRYGVAINPDKLALIFAGQNSALSENKRIRQEALEKYIGELTNTVDEELQAMLREFRKPSTDSQMEADSFLQRWRRIAKDRPFGDALAAINLWAQHVLDDELPPFVNSLATAFVKVLSANPEALTTAEATGSSSAAAFNTSPIELALSVRRHLAAMPAESGLDSQGLLKLEEVVAGSAGTVEAMLPGTSLLRLIAESTDLRTLLDSRLQGSGFSAASKSAGLPAEALVEAIALALKERSRLSGVIDLQLAADVESTVRRRLGASKVGDWAGHGSLSTLLCHTTKELGRVASLITSHGWALRSNDCIALSLWQRHALGVERAGGSQAVASHFGTENHQQQSLAVGISPIAQSVVLHLQRSGLCYEADALVHLKSRCGKNQLPVHDAAEEDMELEAAAAEAEAEGQGLRGHPTVGLLGERDAQTALAALSAVRFLEDVEVATAWNDVYAPSLGSLIDFVGAQDEEGSLLDNGLRLLAVAPRSLSRASLSPRLVRLPPYVEAEANDLLCQAIANGNANLAAAYLTALSVDAPSDVMSLEYYVESGLKQLVDQYGDGKGCRSALGIAMLARLPSGICELVGEAVLLPAIQKENGWPANAILVAERLACIPMLAVLGHRWHVQEWSALLSRALPTEADDGLFLRALGTMPGTGNGIATQKGIAPTSASEPAATSKGVIQIESSLAPCASEALDLVTGTAPTVCCSSENARGVKEFSKVGDDDCGEIIEEIRKGFLLDEDRASQLQLNLGGSLQRLASDLYREQHHFVFELLQNATDCNYPPGVIPHFKLVLQAEQLVALSNEVGFNEKDVKALCAVDSSTKPALSDGRERIGRKGIGFKSVFKITDRPTIHSGPWHFHFDAQLPSRHGKSLKGLGYIVPHCLLASDKQFDGWTTEIRLPFKTCLDQGERAHLRRDLEALNGVLLLNLRSMRCVELADNTVADRPLLRELKRRDLHEHRDGDLTWRIVEISDSGRWFCVEDAFPFEANSEKKIHITLSFPLPSQRSTSDWIRGDLPSLPTYCYLPLRSFGWKVALHANFDVTASRNEIHDNSPWNVKIKQRLPLLFFQALQLAKKKLMLRPQPVGTVDQPREPLKVVALQNPDVYSVPYSFIFKFLPLPGALGGGEGDFFSGVETKIWERLKRERCVLSSEGEWIEPGRALIAPSKMQTIITSELLMKYHNGMNYLHPEFEGITPEVARQLGIGTETVAFSALIRVIKGLVDAEDPLSRNLHWLQSVLLLAYVLIYGDGSRSSIGMDRMGLADSARDKLNTLRSLRFLPVVGGGLLVAPDEDRVFLPSPKDSSDLFSGLVQPLGLKLIDPQLTTAGNEGDIVRRLLEACEVNELSPPELLVDGVLPFLRAEIGEHQLVTLSDCLWFLAEQRHRFEECDALLRPRTQEEEQFSIAIKHSLRLPCRLGGSGALSFVSAGTQVLLPAAFHRRLAAEVEDEDVREAHRQLAETESNLIWESASCIDDCVLHCTSDNEVSFHNFVAFLQSVGATLGMFPVELQEEQIDTSDALLQAAPWFSEVLPQDADFPAKLADFSSPALSQALATMNPMMHMLVTASFTLGLCNHLSASVSFKEAGKFPGPSAIKQALQCGSWIPCEGGQLAPPSEVHLSSPDVPQEVRKHFKFVDTKFSASKRYCDLLGSFGVHSLNAVDLLELLRQWSLNRPSVTEGEIESTYIFLHQCQKRDHQGVDVVHAAFAQSQEPLIFVPKEPRWTKASWEKKVAKSRNLMHGKWICVKDCCIKKFRKRVRGRERDDEPWLSAMDAVRELELHYDLSLKEPFKAFGVGEIVSLEQLCRSIEMAGKTQPFEKASQNMQHILQLISDGSHFSREEYGELRELLARYQATPTQEAKWVAWLCKEDDSIESADHAVEVFLPSLSASVQGPNLLHREILGYRPLYAALGMKEANGPEVVEVPVADATGSDTFADIVVDTSEKMEGTVIERDLRISLAYLQCWLNERTDFATAVQRCNQQVETLQSIGFAVSQELKVNGIDKPAYWDASCLVLHMVNGARGKGLQPALRELLLKSLSLGAKVPIVESLGVDVLIRLADAERPGLASQQVLSSKGFQHADPAAMDLIWWFREPPLPLEERLLSLGGSSNASHAEVGRSTRPAGGTGAAGFGEGSDACVERSTPQHEQPSTNSRRPQHGLPSTSSFEDEAQPSSHQSRQMESSWLRSKVEHIIEAVAHIQRVAQMQSTNDIEAAKRDRDRHIAELRSWLNDRDAARRDTNVADSFTSTPAEGVAGSIRNTWAEWARRRSQQITDVVSAMDQQRIDGTSVEESHLTVCQSHAKDLSEWAATGNMPECYSESSNGACTPANRAQARAEHLDALADEQESRMRTAHARSPEQCKVSATAVQFCRRHANELRKWADSGASCTGPAPWLDLEADPWAEWARQRAQETSHTVSEMERLWPCDVRREEKEQCMSAFRRHAGALQTWADTGETPEMREGARGGASGRAQWARSQADQLDMLADECLSGTSAQHSSPEFCRKHATELRNWAESGASVISPPPGLETFSGTAVSPPAWQEEERLSHLRKTIQAIEQLSQRQQTGDEAQQSLMAQLESLQALAGQSSDSSYPLRSDQISYSNFLDVDQVEHVTDAQDLMPAQPQDLPLGDLQDEQVGRWGEEWVYRHLQRKYDATGARVSWWNEEREQWHPYDISVEHADSSVDYYEVKATVKFDKLVQISEAEILEAKKLAEHFVLVRVYGAGQAIAKMSLFRNVSAQWQTHRSKKTGMELLARVPVPC